MAYTVLVADDEAEIRSLLRLYLEKDGYRVLEAGDGIHAVSLLQKEEIDLVLLDIMMPGLDGYQVLRKLRQQSNIPVMILSAKGADEDKILGLDLGADDYLAKPFNPLEAMARINSNIRRFYSLGAKGGGIKELKVRDLRLDTESCMVYRGETPIQLTAIEYKLLRLLWKIREKCLPNSSFMKRAGGNSSWWQITISWSASANSARSFQRMRMSILRRYVDSATV